MTDWTLSDDILRAFEQATKRFLERGFQPPFVGYAGHEIGNVETSSGLIEFKVDPSLIDMIYVLPKDFDKQEKKKMKIKIREVEEGLPVFIVDSGDVTIVYDPGVLADLVTQVDDENNLTDLQQTAIDIVEFLLENFGCITSQAMVKNLDSFTVNNKI